MKSWTRLSDFTFNFHFHALEKEMATHSSVLAWRIPGTGEPGGLPSMGSHRVGHNWSNLAAASCFTMLRCFLLYRKVNPLCVHTYPLFVDFLPVWVTTEDWGEFPVLHSRFSLVIYFMHSSICMGSPDGSDGEESVCNRGGPGLTPESGRSPEQNDNPLQYCCLKSSMDRVVCGLQHRESDTTEWLTHTQNMYIYVNPNRPIHPTSLSPLDFHVCYLQCVSFCFANEFICTIFLFPTYMR